MTSEIEEAVAREACVDAVEWHLDQARGDVVARELEIERLRGELERIEEQKWMREPRFAEDTDADFLLRVLRKVETAARQALEATHDQ